MCFVPYFRLDCWILFSWYKLTIETCFNLIVGHVMNSFWLLSTFQNETSLIDWHVVGRLFWGISIRASLKIVIFKRFVFGFDDFLSGGNFEIFEFFNVYIKVDWFITLCDFFFCIISVLTVSLYLGCSLNQWLNWKVMSRSTISLSNIFILIEYLFIWLIKWPIGLLCVFRINVELVHWGKIFLSITINLFLFALHLARCNWLPFGFGRILITRLLNKSSVNRFQVLSLYLSVGLVPGWVVSVFLSSSVNQHAFFILFVFHWWKIVGIFAWNWSNRLCGMKWEGMQVKKEINVLSLLISNNIDKENYLFNFQKVQINLNLYFRISWIKTTC